MTSIFSMNNPNETFSSAHLQPFDSYNQLIQRRSFDMESDEKSSNPTLSKTIRTIRKHLTRTTNNEGDINQITEEIQRTFPKQTITTVTIQRTIPNEQHIINFPSNDFNYFQNNLSNSFNDNIYHQQQQGLSTSYTTYHTRTVTVHSNSGANNKKRNGLRMQEKKI